MNPNAEPFKVLTAIAAAGTAGVTNPQIAAELGIKASVVAIHTGALWKKDYLDRRPTASEQRTLFAYCLTPTGRTIIDNHGGPAKAATGKREIERQAERIAAAAVPYTPKVERAVTSRNQGLASLFADSAAITILLRIFGDDSAVVESPNGMLVLSPADGRKLRALYAGAGDG